ncbi:CrcB family protein [Corynebacterium sp. zg-331]|uniref:FluC/FEX family fluoride channel n=1 Tax=unclassified Corynebacterium TaxID=2624378 RepID=UPI00128DA529|nr:MULTISPECIES: CrcB family protein [unclassified Corynebacterium]MBC3186939.1 CrcB family protein [Corynebacterium sp. zg-331]MPV53418.1 CrcB family protein [Corynebacterium sp. zg331]
MIALFAAVAAGAFCGGVGRFALSRSPGGWLGTWCANALACAILALSLRAEGLAAAAWGTGLAGALSTWSTLAAEIGGAVRGGHTRRAALYLGATLCAGCALIALLAPADG